jgi:hypothetical protein
MADKQEATDKAPIPRFELFGHANERYIGHKLLEKVMYNGEPVVPLILSEGNDAEKGPHFFVEKFGGEEFDDYLNDKKIPPVERLRAVSFVLGQLQAIDEAGFVIFDRVGRNILISGKGGNISVRQVDLEDIYDWKNDAVYSDHRRKTYEEYLESQRQFGQSPWAGEVGYLALTLAKAMNQADLKYAPVKAYGELYGYEFYEKNPLAVDPLNGFKREIDLAISKYTDQA